MINLPECSNQKYFQMYYNFPFFSHRIRLASKKKVFTKIQCPNNFTFAEFQIFPNLNPTPMDFLNAKMGSTIDLLENSFDQKRISANPSS